MALAELVGGVPDDAILRLTKNPWPGGDAVTDAAAWTTPSWWTIGAS